MNGLRIPGQVTGASGASIAPFKGQLRNIKAQFEVNLPLAKVSFEVPFGQGPKFARGIHKIALSSLAYFLGHELAASPAFDAVRAHVVKGHGDRQVLFRPVSDQKYSHLVTPPYVSRDGLYLVGMRLGIMEFIVDLSPQMSLLQSVHEKSLGTDAEYHPLNPAKPIAL